MTFDGALSALQRRLCDLARLGLSAVARRHRPVESDCPGSFCQFCGGGSHYVLPFAPDCEQSGAERLPMLDV